MKTTLLPCLAALVLASSLNAQTPAPSDAPAGNGTLPVAELSCRALLQSSGDERDLLLALYHGYVAGKADAASLDTVNMSFVTDKVIDHCIETPSDTVLAAFAASSG